MGREVRRVPLVFDHPLGHVWPGFVNPYYVEQQDCLTCGGDGYSLAGKLLKALWYLRLYHHIIEDLLSQHKFPPLLCTFAHHVIASGQSWRDNVDQDDVAALLAADRLWEFTRIPRTPEQVAIIEERIAAGHDSWLPFNNGYIPTSSEVNTWNKLGLGHDSIDASICEQARATRYGVSAACHACAGTGHTSNPDLEAKIEAWTKTDPPLEDGWQLWETVSEGSPISPVFATADALMKWIIKEYGYSPQSARVLLRQAWAPSFVGVEGVWLTDGVRAAGLHDAVRNEHMGS